MAECPFIDRSFTPDPRFNKAINFRDMGGQENYVFYDHDDGFGSIMRVQFCKLCGLKRNVFQCLNEIEWKACFYYRVRMMADAKDRKGGVGVSDIPGGEVL